MTSLLGCTSLWQGQETLRNYLKVNVRRIPIRLDLVNVKHWGCVQFARNVERVSNAFLSHDREWSNELGRNFTLETADTTLVGRL